MNKHRVSDSTAPAQTARRAVGDSRPQHAHALEALLAALLGLLALLVRATPGSALACALLGQATALLRAWLRPRARAATPEQHARALRTLRLLHAAPPFRLPKPSFRASRAARRRAAECWRMLVNPPRRRASFARPASARPLPRHTRPRMPRLHPQPRARPPPSPKHPPTPIAFVCPINAML